MIVHWQEVPETERHAGHFRRQLEFSTCYFALHRYELGSEGYDLHQHAEVQVGHVLEGAMDMMLPDGPAVVSAGDSYVIPSGMVHGGHTRGKRSVVLNVYIKPQAARNGDADPTSRQICWDRVPSQTPAPGIARGLLVGDRVLLARYDVAPHATLDRGPHAHAHDELAVLLDGDLELAIGDEAAPMRPGDCYHVPGHVDHVARVGPRGAKLLRFYIAPKPGWVARYHEGPSTDATRPPSVGGSRGSGHG